MNETDLDALESASLAAWPALRHDDLDGWRLRFAGGYTKRANSANALRHHDTLRPELLKAIEARYREQDLPTVFRLASFRVGPQVDRTLAEQGYRHADRTLVMSAPLDASCSSADHRVDWMPDARSWLATGQAIAHGLSPADQATHLRMLESIAGECAFATIRVSDAVLCSGLGVLTGGLLGLFEIATGSGARRQGLGGALCRALMDWGLRHGAREVYLQVVATNTGAIRLYENLGLRERYHYWYRLR